MPDPNAVMRNLLTEIKGNISSTNIGSYLRDDVGSRKADPAKGERQLGSFILPAWQRPPVWDARQKVRLIESIWMSLPIAAFAINECVENPETDLWLIDGQQRWTSIMEYVKDAFPVQGYLFSELPIAEQRDFKLRPFACLTLKSDDPALLEEVYHRLAYGGVAHDPEDAPSFRM